LSGEAARFGIAECGKAAWSNEEPSATDPQEDNQVRFFYRSIGRSVLHYSVSRCFANSKLRNSKPRCFAARLLRRYICVRVSSGEAARFGIAECGKAAWSNEEPSANV